MLTPGKTILPLLLQGLKLTTFWSRVQRSNPELVLLPAILRVGLPLFSVALCPQKPYGLLGMGSPRTLTSTFTQLLSSERLACMKSSFVGRHKLPCPSSRYVCIYIWKLWATDLQEVPDWRHPRCWRGSLCPLFCTWLHRWPCPLHLHTGQEKPSITDLQYEGQWYANVCCCSIHQLNSLAVTS